MDTLENYKEICQPIKTEKCQKVLKDSQSVSPAHKDNPYYSTDNLSTINIICHLNENNELCPISKKYYSFEKKNYSKKDTCKSKICTDSIVTYIGNVVKENKLYEIVTDNEKNYIRRSI